MAMIWCTVACVRVCGGVCGTSSWTRCTVACVCVASSWTRCTVAYVCVASSWTRRTVAYVCVGSGVYHGMCVCECTFRVTILDLMSEYSISA